MQRAAVSLGQRPTPKLPKIPQSIKDRHPENKGAWDEYDLAWENFFKEASQIQK